MPCKINRFKNYMGVHDKAAHPYFLLSGCVKKCAKNERNKKVKSYTLWKKCVRVEPCQPLAFWNKKFTE